MKPHYQPLPTILLASTLLCSLSSYSNAQDHLKITSLGAELQFQHEQQRQRHSVPAQHAGPVRYIGPGIDTQR